MRKEIRHVPYKPILQIAPFSSQAAPSAALRARLTHCSDGGVRFISSKAFNKDTSLYIRVEPDGSRPYGGWEASGLKSAAVARVQWSRPIESDKGLFYEIGAQYF